MKKLIFLFLFVSFLFAQDRILIDENYDDWNDVTTLHEDPSGDNSTGTFDFKTMWVTNDEDYLYIRIETTKKFNLVDYNYMTIFIDSDNNPATGKLINGIGAELQYTFGTRSGKAFLSGETNIEHDNIGFIGAPTFSGNDFEFVISRDSRILGTDLFQSSTIKIVMTGYTSSSLSDYYDKTPDSGGFEYTFQSGEVDPPPAYSISKTNVGYLRMMAYNIEGDNITNDEPEVQQKFNNVFIAVKPDIIGFSEVYSSSAQAVADRVENYLPSEDGQQWYNKKITDYDVVIVSRFKIKNSYPIETSNVSIAHNASSAFLLDLRPKYDSDMLVIVAHPKCCNFEGDEDEKRQNQFDAIMGFIRDAMNEGGDLTISPDIPIVIMGDMNLVGDVRQYTTLITGDIYYTGTYGEDFAPDWDGSDLDDAKPYVTNTGMTFTTNPGSYPPGRLDFLVYSGSVMQIVNSYIFDSGNLTNDQLSQFGLDAADTKVSDHLPVVVDFDLSPIVGIKKKDESPKNFRLMQNYPNPFNPSTIIKFTIPSVETLYRASLQQTKLVVYDILGKEIKTLLNKPMQPGEYEIEFNAEDLSSGVYYYRIIVGDFTQTKKMVLLR